VCVYICICVVSVECVREREKEWTHQNVLCTSRFCVLSTTDFGLVCTISQLCSRHRAQLYTLQVQIVRNHCAFAFGRDPNQGSDYDRSRHTSALHCRFVLVVDLVISAVLIIAEYDPTVHWITDLCWFRIWPNRYLGHVMLVCHTNCANII
jgi:hypothetical protein